LVFAGTRFRQTEPRLGTKARVDQEPILCPIGQAALMGALVITCPETGKRFSTGIQTDEDDLYTISQDTVSASYCPYCGQDHKWRYRDAEWVATLPPEDWVENK
jgi:hypothetical protein